jgi:hypothetical protein
LAAAPFVAHSNDLPVALEGITSAGRPALRMMRNSASGLA